MQMMGRNNCQQPVRPCSQPRNVNSCPMPTAPPSGPGPVRPESGCSCSGLSKEQLLQRIFTTGFACVDASLYLDTHPEDTGAISYFGENNRKYQEALHEYSQKYGPLTLAHVHHPEDYWNWVDQPWPWQ